MLTVTDLINTGSNPTPGAMAFARRGQTSDLPLTFAGGSSTSNWTFWNGAFSTNWDGASNGIMLGVLAEGATNRWRASRGSAPVNRFTRSFGNNQTEGWHRSMPVGLTTVVTVAVTAVFLRLLAVAPLVVPGTAPVAAPATTVTLQAIAPSVSQSAPGVTGTGSATIRVSTTSVGSVAVSGTGVGQLTLTASGAGTLSGSGTVIGTGSPAIRLSTVSTGSVTVRGTGAGRLSLAANGAGTLTGAGTIFGTGNPTLGLSTVSTGSVTVRGTGSATLALQAFGLATNSQLVTLTPNITQANQGWTAVGAATVDAALAAGDADYITANSAGAVATVALNDPPTALDVSSATLVIRARV